MSLLAPVSFPALQAQSMAQELGPQEEKRVTTGTQGGEDNLSG